MNRIYAWLGVPNTNKSPRWYNGAEYKQHMYPQLRPSPLVVSGLAAIGNYLCGFSSAVEHLLAKERVESSKLLIRFHYEDYEKRNSRRSSRSSTMDATSYDVNSFWWHTSNPYNSTLVYGNGCSWILYAESRILRKER